MRIVLAVIVGIVVFTISVGFIFVVLDTSLSALIDILTPLPDGIAINDPEAVNIAGIRILTPLFTALFVSLLLASFLGATIARKISKGAQFAPWLIIAWPMIAMFIELTSNFGQTPLYGSIVMGICALLLPPAGVYLAQKFTRPYLFTPVMA